MNNANDENSDSEDTVNLDIFSENDLLTSEEKSVECEKYKKIKEHNNIETLTYDYWDDKLSKTPT